MGGGVGSLARYAVTLHATRLAGGAPLGTVAVNAIGSLLIGVMLPLLTRLPPVARPLFVVGFLGGFTTMSSYAAEVVTHLAARQYLEAAGLWAAGAIGCTLLCAVGYALGSRLGL